MMTTTTNVSAVQNVAMEAAKQKFEDMKKAKKELMIAIEEQQMENQLAQDGGVITITYNIEIRMDDLDHLSRKREEFPNDELTNIELEVAEAKLDAIIGAGDRLITRRAFGMNDEPMMKEWLQRSRERRVYNSYWGEAKDLYVRGERDELSMMFLIIRERFELMEIAYNRAVAENDSQLQWIGLEFDKTLTAYNSSLNIQFDLDEWIQRRQNRMNIEITAEQKAYNKQTVKLLRGNRPQLTRRLKEKYDTLQEAEIKLRKKPDDSELTLEVVLAESDFNNLKAEVAIVEAIEVQDALEVAEYG